MLGREPEPCAESDPRCAVHAIERFRGRRFVIFLLSDFIDHDEPEDLKYFKKRHDVSLIHLYDPLEYAAASHLRLAAFAPEGDGRLASLAPGETGSLEEMTAFLERECGKYGIDFGSFPTTDPVSGALTGLFQKKLRRLEH